MTWDERRMVLCQCTYSCSTTLLLALQFCGTRKRKENCMIESSEWYLRACSEEEGATAAEIRRC